MIIIDRAASTSVHDQLVEQLRYQIASGHYNVGDLLPSTRGLGKQLGVSFHTVRKAYQQLEEEGLLTARPGSGYEVRERTPLDKAERIERGAQVVQEALQRLIGLGLAEDEINYLVQEQLGDLQTGPARLKIVVAGPFREFAEACAEQLSLSLQRAVQAETLDRLDRHEDADYLIVPFAAYTEARTALPRVECIGMATYWQPEALEQVARLLPHETLGLVTQHADAVQPLMRALRAQTRFGGQTVAVSIEERPRHLEQVLRPAHLILYTSGCRRRLRRLLEGQRHALLQPRVTSESVEQIRQTVPR